ncbi:unnamed protein product [Eruca vesicaria subsp. sativa]|uniref:Bifunctional inhibitor/plant lipid transfer protein/seed storage helical domain-containing protein n=1 Tax=Eruca vesicaria subsp. sativa TaxID=29727 RepID=A0ABC8KL98_ERUVS|nr:unnamed protein product [Eruca vesicaria subsp. sativa]
MAYTYKVPVAAAVATAVLFLAVMIAPQWTEATKPKTIPPSSSSKNRKGDPCPLAIPEIVKHCYATMSLVPSEKCCKDLKTASKKEVNCLCNKFIANPSNRNLTRPLYDQISRACGVLKKFACNGKGGEANGGAKNKIVASIFGLIHEFDDPSGSRWITRETILTPCDLHVSTFHCFLLQLVASSSSYRGFLLKFSNLTSTTMLGPRGRSSSVLTTEAKVREQEQSRYADQRSQKQGKSTEQGGQEHGRAKRIASAIVSPHGPTNVTATLEVTNQPHVNVVPYEQQGLHRSSNRNSKEALSTNHPKPWLKSTIVPPLPSSQEMDTNVTKRVKGAPRALTFSPNSLQADINGQEGDQMIGALNDMETTMDMEEEKLDYGEQDDDLLGEELMALQETERKDTESHKYSGSSSSSAVIRKDRAKISREKNRSNAPISSSGFPKKLCCFLSWTARC